MKVALLLACTCAVYAANGASIQAPLDLITLEDLSEANRHALEYLDAHYPGRPKRGSADAFSLLKASIGQGIKNKLGMLAKGSAATVSHFSGASSGGGHGYHHHHDIPESYDHKTFDFWTLKKSILNTLLQAVKAIKGGVIALKGQLIKGSGYLVSAKGKLISAKGEAITNLGKNIASSAVLIPHTGHSGHAGYGQHIHYEHPSGPTGDYGAPSAPGPEYGLPEHYHQPHHHEDKPHIPDDTHAGILILKKIPHSGHQHGHEAQESKVPPFKPIEPAGPSFGTIVGKFFTASTSLQAGEPAPFGHTAPDAAPGHYDDSYESHSAPPSHDDHRQHHDDIHHHHHHHPPYSPSSHAESHEYPPPHPSGPQEDHSSPFEKAPTYLNYDEFPSESKKATQQAPSGPENPHFHAESVQDRPPPSAAAAANGGGFSNPLPDVFDKPKLLVGSTLPANENFPPYPEPMKGQNFGETFANPGGVGVQFLAAPTGGVLHSPPLDTYNLQATNLHTPIRDLNSYSAHFPLKHHPTPYANIPISPNGHPTKIKGLSRSNMLPPQPPKQPYDIVKSISYELRPNGPKRL